MKVHITEAKIGDTIIKDVFNSFGLHVLSKKTVLGEKEIQKLFNHSVEYIDIDYRSVYRDASDNRTADPSAAGGSTDSFLSLRDPSELGSHIASFEAPAEYKSHLVRTIQPCFSLAVDSVQLLFDQVSLDGHVDKQLIDEAFTPLTQSLRKEHDVISLLLSLTGKDDYTYMHSVQVGMLSYYLSKWLGKDEKEAVITAKAGFMHDIGKSKIPENILKKPGKLTDEEYEEIKKHTIYGHEILSRSNVEESLSLVALQHHERLNGSGYPQGLTAGQMHPLSMIIAVADIYSAMISNRVYQRKKDLLVVLQELYRLSFADLNPEITQTFIQKMLPNFIGKKVTFQNGEAGSIVMMNPTDYFHPLVTIDGTFIDLSRQKDLVIDSILI